MEQLPDVVRRIKDGRAGKVIPSDNMQNALADVRHVVEAVPENLDPKMDVFKQIDTLCPMEYSAAILPRTPAAASPIASNIRNVCSTRII